MKKRNTKIPLWVEGKLTYLKLPPRDQAKIRSQLQSRLREQPDPEFTKFFPCDQLTVRQAQWAAGIAWDVLNAYFTKGATRGNRELAKQVTRETIAALNGKFITLKTLARDVQVACAARHNMKWQDAVKKGLCYTLPYIRDTLFKEMRDVDGDVFPTR